MRVRREAPPGIQGTVAVYDLLAGKYGFGSSQLLSREQTLDRIPTLKKEGLRGGVIYYDGQFDDARLAIALLQTLQEQNGLAANYAEVIGLTKSGNKLNGVVMRDRETGAEHPVQAKVVINATGYGARTLLKDESIIPVRGQIAWLIPQLEVNYRVIYSVRAG